MSTEHDAVRSDTAQSPADKLDDRPLTDADTPGAQNPASEEIKQEQQPNTE